MRAAACDRRNADDSQHEVRPGVMPTLVVGMRRILGVAEVMIAANVVPCQALILGLNEVVRGSLAAPKPAC